MYSWAEADAPGELTFPFPPRVTPVTPPAPD